MVTVRRFVGIEQRVIFPLGGAQSFAVIKGASNRAQDCMVGAACQPRLLHPQVNFSCNNNTLESTDTLRLHKSQTLHKQTSITKAHNSNNKNNKNLSLSLSLSSSLNGKRKKAKAPRS